MKKFLMIGLLAALVASGLGQHEQNPAGRSQRRSPGRFGRRGRGRHSRRLGRLGRAYRRRRGRAGRRHHRPRAKQEQKLVKLCQLRAGLPRPYRAARKRGGLFCSRHSALAVPDFIGAARPCGHTCCNSRQILRHCARSPTPPTLAAGVRSGVPTGVLRVGGACPTIFFGP